ncbi:MAG: yabG [Bacilli bacterium]|nr:yabG [Bacilli bacterium]
MWKVGDRVMRRSYGGDICFIVTEVDQTHGLAILKGVEVRLVADAPFDDLEPVSDDQWQQHSASFERVEQDLFKLIWRRKEIDLEKRSINTVGGYMRGNEDFFERPGRVLHLDGDGRYLQKCLNYYKSLRVPADGHHIEEGKMAEVLMQFLQYYQPDILILTGHDGVLRKGQDLQNIYNYRNSDHFIRAVKVARQFERSLDELVIFAGACQSHYEGLLKAGANFASSPSRILIHALDPVFIAERLAFTPVGKMINIYDAVKSTITGTEGLGGIETRGKYRMGLPKAAL